MPASSADSAQRQQLVGQRIDALRLGQRLVELDRAHGAAEPRGHDEVDRAMRDHGEAHQQIVEVGGLDDAPARSRRAGP